MNQNAKKTMSKLRVIISTVLFIAVCIAVFAGCRPDIDTRGTEAGGNEAMEALKPAKMIKIGDHTYYPDYVFERRNIDADPEEYIIERLEAADGSLDEDIFIWAISISENEGATTAHASYIKHGMLLKHRGLSFDYKIDSKLGAEWHDYGQEDYDPSTDGLMPEEEIVSIAYEAADKHRSQMRGTGISGTYIIWAEYSGNIYYDFTVNTCSKIRIDARTGEILYENYWDGRIT